MPPTQTLNTQYLRITEVAYLFSLKEYCGIEQRQLGRLITSRSEVRIFLPLPRSSYLNQVEKFPHKEKVTGSNPVEDTKFYPIKIKVMREQLEGLDSIVNSKMEILSQITIDLVENTLCDFEDEGFSADAQIYNIRNILEIIRPGLILDISLLQQLLKILEKNKL